MYIYICTCIYMYIVRNMPKEIQIQIFNVNGLVCAFVCVGRSRSSSSCPIK